jgi:O-acetylserine/cysteine efflux transporter
LPIIIQVKQSRIAILALAAAGALWGLTVPLSKLALAWLDPSWLTVARFALAAPLIALAGRRGLRDALTPGIAGAGAAGFGVVIVLQNAGIERTSVSHAALVVGAVPVLVALIAASTGKASTPPTAWAGYGLALAGIALVAGAGGSGATVAGDALVLLSVALSAAFIVIQPRLLAGRDAAAVTAVQFAAAALVAVPIAALTDGAPTVPGSAAPALALAALALAGTLVPFWLFAFGQARVPAEIAGAFVNLEPVVGTAVGWIAFGETASVSQLGGAVAVLTGIALSLLPAAPRPRVTASLTPRGDAAHAQSLQRRHRRHLARGRRGLQGPHAPARRSRALGRL